MTKLKIGSLMALAALLLGACTSAGEEPADAQQTALAQTLEAALTLTAEAGGGLTQATATTPPETTPGEIATLALSPTSDKALIKALQDTNCRFGPSTVYDVVSYLLVSDGQVEVMGRHEGGGWWYILDPKNPNRGCWVWEGSTQVVGPTDDLAIITPPPTPTPAPASIAGVVWEDRCGYYIVKGTPSPDDCVDLGGPPQANAQREPGEPGIPGVVVALGEGGCPSSGLATDTTDGEGAYAFNGLSAGEYCVSVNAVEGGNVAILIPGSWTYPYYDDGSSFVQITVQVEAGEDKTGVDFGWEFQFAP